MGMRFVYLEAGSGAPEIIPPEIGWICKKIIDIPLIVGGGIRSPESAKNLLLQERIYSLQEQFLRKIRGNFLILLKL